MLNEDKIKQMTRLAVIEQRDGDATRPMREYFRSDYVSKEMLFSFITGTIAYFVILALYAVYSMEELLENLNRLDLQGMLVTLILIYLVFMAVYMILTFAVYSVRYTRGRRKIRQYYMEIKKMNKLYNKED